VTHGLDEFEVALVDSRRERPGVPEWKNPVGSPVDDDSRGRETVELIEFGPAEPERCCPVSGRAGDLRAARSSSESSQSRSESSGEPMSARIISAKAAPSNGVKKSGPIPPCGSGLIVAMNTDDRTRSGRADEIDRDHSAHRDSKRCEPDRRRPRRTSAISFLGRTYRSLGGTSRTRGLRHSQTNAPLRPWSTNEPESPIDC